MTEGETGREVAQECGLWVNKGGNGRQQKGEISKLNQMDGGRNDGKAEEGSGCDREREHKEEAAEHRKKKSGWRNERSQQIIYEKQ